MNDCIAEKTLEVLDGRDAMTLCGDYDVELFAKRMQNGDCALSMKCATGWELIRLMNARGDVEYSRALFGCVAETIIATLHNAPVAPKPVEAPQACEADNVPAALEAVAPSAAKAPRCAWYRDIRRAYAIARERGLDLKADEAMRIAFGRFLGRTIESREAMNGGDWLLVGNGIKAHRLIW